MILKIIFFYISIILLLNSCNKNDLSFEDINKITSIDIIEDIPIEWEEKTPCTIIYDDGEQTIELRGKIKYRGGISSKYAKHSYALELDQKFPLGGLPADDDWILNANYIDKTFMRHKISYDIFREMSTKNVAAKCAYVNLSTQNKYKGLYVLMEEINGAMAEINKSDTLAMLFKDPPIFIEDKLSYVQDSLNYYQQKFPKINDSDKTYYIENFKNFIFYSSDAEFARNISYWIDVNNVIDWHIILLFSNNADGILKNFYLYKLNKDTPFRFAIWDYDHSYGRDGDNEMNLMERELDCNKSVLLKRLMQLPETGYANKIKQRWFELRDLKIISQQSFKAHIVENDKIIKNYIQENFEKWPVDAEWYYDNNDYEQELQLMLEFVKIRIDQLDKYFSNL